MRVNGGVMDGGGKCRFAAMQFARVKPISAFLMRAQ